LYLIDPYEPYLDKDTFITKEMQENFFDIACMNLRYFKENFVFIKDFSENAVDLIPDELDFVYIDADHNHEGVKKDLELYFPKVRVGEIIGGHDFSYDFPGIPKAVLEFVDMHSANTEFIPFHSNGNDPHLSSVDWMVMKKLSNLYQKRLKVSFQYEL